MTVEEIRKEYKNLEPIGDERDGLFISQINAQTGKPEPVQPQPVPQSLELTTEPPEEMQPDEEVETEEVVQEEEKTTAAQKAALMRWKRYAIRTFGKGEKDFTHDDIPAELAQAIKAKLLTCKSVGDVADVFEETKPLDPVRIDITIRAIKEALNFKAA
jgi:hypothetical protein